MAQLKDLTIDDAGFIRLPAGTSGERPSSPQNGMMRYNTDINKFEHYTGSGWEEVLLSQSSSLPSANISGVFPNTTMPTNSVIQVQYFRTGSSVTASGGDSSYNNLQTGDITPSSTSSKIYIFANTHVYYGTSSSTFNWYAANTRILRDGSNIYNSDGSRAGSGYTIASRHNGSDWRKMGQIRMIHIDSPNTESNITYTIQGCTRKGQSYGTVIWNRYADSELLLMEIAG